MGKHHILGINIGFHDAAAALVADGAIVNLVEQEKISRHKHAVAESPAQAVKHCLRDAGLELDSISQIGIGWDIPATPMGRSRRFQPERMAAMLFGELGLDARTITAHAGRVQWVDHHLAHAASAYFSLGADDLDTDTPTAILVIDGAGEHSSTTLAVGMGSSIRVLDQHPISQSLGFYYSAATRWTGLGDFGEGKLMGLASYGRASPAPGLKATSGGYEIESNGEPLQLVTKGGAPELMMNQFPAFEAAVRLQFSSFFPYCSRSTEGVIAYADFAASIQQGLEEAVVGLTRHLAAITGAKRLVIAGGVAMNCSMIGRLLREDIFERLYVPPIPTDVGVSLGAALWLARTQAGFAPTRIDHAAWSLPLHENDKQFSKVVTELQLAAIPVALAVVPEAAARAVAAGNIVGWAQGRAEVGERALGCRSIVGDPRSRQTLAKLNLVKGREMWRPVAPSVLREHYKDYFLYGAKDPMRFMLAADHVRMSARCTVPAITHVDGTARPQVVDQALNPAYWELIDRFREATGVAMVTNTSFNLADEPIVCSATDAARTLARSEGLDVVFAGGLALSKSHTVLEAVLGHCEPVTT